MDKPREDVSAKIPNPRSALDQLLDEIEVKADIIVRDKDGNIKRRLKATRIKSDGD